MVGAITKWRSASGPDLDPLGKPEMTAPPVGYAVVIALTFGRQQDVAGVADTASSGCLRGVRSALAHLGHDLGRGELDRLVVGAIQRLEHEILHPGVRPRLEVLRHLLRCAHHRAA